MYRDYANADGAPINLFIAPEPVGGDTPANCAFYQGSVITELSLQPVVGVPGLMLNEIVLRSGGTEDQMSVCAYYWRTPNGPVNDSAINLLRGRLVGLRGRTSFRVDMCTQVRDVSETSAAFERLSEFASLVDPEVRKSLQEAIESGK